MRLLVPRVEGVEDVRQDVDVDAELLRRELLGRVRRPTQIVPQARPVPGGEARIVPDDRALCCVGFEQ